MFFVDACPASGRFFDDGRGRDGRPMVVTFSIGSGSVVACVIGAVRYLLYVDRAQPVYLFYFFVPVARECVDVDILFNMVSCNYG